MTDIGIENERHVSLETLLKTHPKFVVPPFQREYSWKKENWRDFLEDISQSKEHKRGHFFGFMTFKKLDDGYIIIEGQQRIATTTIFIAVVRDLMQSMGDIDWEGLQNDYVALRKSHSRARDRVPDYKLTLSDFNQTFFRRFVQTPNIPKVKLQEKRRILNLSERRIYDCYKYFYDELIKVKSEKNLSDSELGDLLLELVAALVENFVVFAVDVKNELVAYSIFQTLNNRGLELALSDLLKVHLFSYADKKWEEAKAIWDEIRDTLSYLDINTFLRHYWLSKKGVVRESELLRALQEEVQTSPQVFNFLYELKAEAETYEALVNLRADYWNKGTIVLLDKLKTLSARMPLPILMASYRSSMLKADFEEIIRIYTSFIFRYVTIADRDNKVLERLLSDIAIEIRDEKIKNVAEVKGRLKKEYVRDEDFRPIFATKEIQTSKVARYILQEIEVHLDGEKEFSKKITWEHILPRNPDTEWRKYIQENKIEKDRYVDRIGNMTLLLDIDNEEILNYFFTTKRDTAYKTSELKINESLKTITSWTNQDIENRQAEWADLALKIWSI